MRPLGLLVALAALLAVPATATAALPVVKTTTIVPGRSIAGLKVGMTVPQALAAWGTGTTCTAETRQAYCYYRGTERQGDASFIVDKAGKVVTITISAGRKGINLVYAGPLQRWRTTKGIRLGSTTAQVVKAYPKAKGAGYGIQLGSGSRTTALATSAGRMYQISVGTIDF